MRASVAQADAPTAGTSHRQRGVPRRPAGTASALMIGLALVAFVSTFAASLENVQVPVAAVVDVSGFDTSWFLDAATFRDGGGEAPVFNAYLRFEDGVDPETGIAAVEDALADYPQVGVLDQAGLAESVGEQLDLLLGVIVALLGAALGVPFGAAFVAVEQFNIDTFMSPWGQLAVGVVVAAAAGLLAGPLPARRAARLDVLRALQTE